MFAIGLMFPFAVAILPLYVLLRELDLLDNPLGVILPRAAFGLPVTIVILRAFFRAIPAELAESATLDGCGPSGFFWRILLPMARPALATVSVLAIVASWNNFMLPTPGPSRSASPSSTASAGPTPHAYSPTCPSPSSPHWPSTPSPNANSSAVSPPAPPRGDHQATVQAAPLRANEVGSPVLPVWLAWKPMLIDAPAAIPAL